MPNEALRHVDAARDFEARNEDATPKDAMDTSVEDARGHIRALRVNWVHTSAHQLKRILGGTDGASKRLLDFAGEAAGQREEPQAPDIAPHWAVAGTPTAASFHGKVQVALLFSDDAAALHGMGMRSKNPPLTPGGST